jgi:hypothetical protein
MPTIQTDRVNNIKWISIWAKEHIVVDVYLCRWGENVFLNCTTNGPIVRTPGDVSMASQDDDHVGGVRIHLWTVATIVQVSYEHGETWRNDIDRWNILIRPPDLSGNSTSWHHVASRRNVRRELWIWSCQEFLFMLASAFLHVIKS